MWGRVSRFNHAEVTIVLITARGESITAILYFPLQHNGDYLYLLKWKGYPESENSWEPVSNLSCDSLLQAYRQKHNLIPSQRTHSDTSKRSKQHRRPPSFSSSSSSTSSFPPAPTGSAETSSRMVFKKRRRKREVSPIFLSEGESSYWNVKRMRKEIRKNKKMKKRMSGRRLRSLVVSISLKRLVADQTQSSLVSSSSSNPVTISKDHHHTHDHSHDYAHHDSNQSDYQQVNTRTTCSNTHQANLQPQVHELMCIRHDHTYSGLIEGTCEALPPPVLTPPPSAEPCDSLAFDGRSSGTPEHDPMAFTVQISPPPSPSPASPYRCNNSPQYKPLSSPLTSAKLHDDTDSDHTFQRTLDPTDGSSPQVHTGSPLHLHLSSTSSSDMEESEMAAPRDGGRGTTTDVSQQPLKLPPPPPLPDEGNLSEHLQSVLLRLGKRQSNGFGAHTHRRDRDLFLSSRWRKGPVPLPRSFSKRQSPTSQLLTKAAKLQLHGLVNQLSPPRREMEKQKEKEKNKLGREQEKEVVMGATKAAKHQLHGLVNQLSPPVASGREMEKQEKEKNKVGRGQEKEVVMAAPKPACHQSCVNGLSQLLKQTKAKFSLSLKNKPSLTLEHATLTNTATPATTTTTKKSKKPSAHHTSEECSNNSENQSEETGNKCRDVALMKPARKEPSGGYAYKEQLMNWQYELNKQRDGTDDIIYVENEVDTAPPPLDFNYICSNRYARGIPNPSHPDISGSLCGCECYYLGRKCGPKSEYCCAHMAGSKFAYSPAGKVRVPPGTPIYECNAKCSCPSDCSNRIVQLGRKIPLCIFRTVGRGWGVKTIEPIKPNTFITEYVGEVISNEEAERRGKKCDARGITYLFDLDFEDENSAFTIDAAKYGNISHFFNHSVSWYAGCLGCHCESWYRLRSTQLVG